MKLYCHFRLYTYFCITLITIILTGCGGGSSDDNQPTTNQKITISALPLTYSVNEGENVTISLNTLGDDSNALSYDWELKNNNQTIPFVGQNTDTISFTAPDVVNSGTITVSVKIDFPNGTLIGPNNQQSLITIHDLNPPAETQAYELAKTTNLPEVTQLDISHLLVESTWIMTNYSTLNFIDNDTEFTLQQTEILPFTVQSADINDLNILSCGKSNESTISLSNYADGITCEAENQVTKYYQDNDNMRLEVICGEKIVQASNLKKISDIKTTDLGELSIEFDTYSDQPATTDVCGVVTVNELRFADSNSEGLITSNITLISQYLGEPLEVSLDVDDTPEFNVFLFFSQRNSELKFKGAAFKNSMLPTINNITEQDSGSITITSFSLPSLTGRFDIDVTDIDGDIENVKGEFNLVLE